MLTSFQAAEARLAAQGYTTVQSYQLQPAEVTNLPTRLLWGEEAIEEEILGLRFRVRPNAFLQTNTEMAETLYGLAREFAGLHHDGPGHVQMAGLCLALQSEFLSCGRQMGRQARDESDGRLSQ